MLVQIENAASARAQTPSDWNPDFRLFDTEFGHHLLMVNGSRIYTVPEELIDALHVTQGHEASAEILQAYGLTAAPYIDDEVLRDPPVRAISLAIAQSCNLGCAYCYAQQGSFGGDARVMERSAAMGAIDLLLAAAEAGDRVQVTYLGVRCHARGAQRGPSAFFHHFQWHAFNGARRRVLRAAWICRHHKPRWQPRNA
jgi:hypothetical protein